MTNCGYGSRLVADLSRRDNRTKPGVLTPGIDKQGASPEGAHQNRARARIWGWGSGVLEYCPWSELRPRTRVGDAEGAEEFSPVVRLLADSLGATGYHPCSSSNPADAGCNSGRARVPARREQVYFINLVKRWILVCPGASVRRIARTRSLPVGGLAALPGQAGRIAQKRQTQG
jgi:hypothetical protein